MGHVGRGDEHDLGEVVLDVEIVIGEGVVLFRIEHFQQRRGGIAAEVHRHLVHFVEEEDRVDRAGLLHPLDDLAGEGADVRAAVAADLGLVADAAEGEADELASGGAGDRLRQRGLPYARRADEAEDRPLGLLHELAHGQELENALLDLIEAVVVLVEDLLGQVDVLDLFRRLLPGDGDEPFDVIAGDGRFRGDAGHRFQALELLDGLFLGVLRHARLFDLLAELLDLVRAVVLPAQLVVDGLDLLVEVILFLRTLHLLLDLGVDALVDVDLLDLDLQEVLQLLQALVRRGRLQELLLLGRGDEDVRGQRVGEAVGVVELQRRHHAFEGQVVGELGVLLEDLHQLLHVLGDLRGEGDLGVDLAHNDGDVAVGLLRGDDLGAGQPLHHHFHVLVGELQVLDDRGHDADAVDLVHGRIVDLRIALGGQEDSFFGGGERRLERRDGGAASDDEGRHHRGEDHHVAQGNERELDDLV